MRSIVPAIVIVGVVATAAASAHHSHPDFLAEQDATVEGTIERPRWLADQPRVFVTPIPGPVRNDSLKVGDRVVVTGVPPRDPGRREIVNLKAIGRPADNWLWTCRRPPGHSC